MALNARAAEQLSQELRGAVVKCSELCLYQSAKWAAELLDSIPLADSIEQNDEDAEMSPPPPAVSPSRVITDNVDPHEAALEAREFNKYILAKSFFDCREYDRCAAVFLPHTLLSALHSMPTNAPRLTRSSKAKSKARSPSNGKATHVLPKLSQKSMFLALYAKYMSGEKKRDEEIEMVMGPHDSGKTVNRELGIINRCLSDYFDERAENKSGSAESQGWLEYLYGIVLAKQKNEDEALKWLLRSVKLYQWNWGAWQEILSLLERTDALNELNDKIAPSLPCFIFHCHAEVEFFQHSDKLSNQINELLSIFPTSSFMLTMRALNSYHAKNFDVSVHQFGELQALHPYRLDSLDHYSNALYVMNQRPKLSFLAHICVNVDRFRPETCVVVGNYYSLLSHHEKAVTYFRRALTLDRNCLSAWTLMGHEYIELKNSHAAIESYRRAVDLNRRDYRAWYGLGQAYEVLEMHAYGVWYFKRAAGLRPWDSKMWAAVGECLQQMGRNAEGIKALKRALFADNYYEQGVGSSFGSSRLSKSKPMDTELLLRIANMHEHMGNEDATREYMELCVAQESGLADRQQLESSGASVADVVMDDDDELHSGTGVTISTCRARMWLARYAVKHREWEAAMRLAQELCDDGHEVEEAKAIIREVRSSVESASGLR